MEETVALIATMNCVLYDPDNQEKSFTFLVFLSNWLLRLLDNQRCLYPVRMIQLSVKKEVPDKWRRIPEFLIEIITDQFSDIARYFMTVERLRKGMRQIYCEIDLGLS